MIPTPEEVEIIRAKVKHGSENLAVTDRSKLLALLDEVFAKIGEAVDHSKRRTRLTGPMANQGVEYTGEYLVECSRLDTLRDLREKYGVVK